MGGSLFVGSSGPFQHATCVVGGRTVLVVWSFWQSWLSLDSSVLGVPFCLLGDFGFGQFFFVWPFVVVVGGGGLGTSVALFPFLR